MAQAFQRFGSEVTVLEVAPQIMGLEDDDAAKLLRQVLEEEGVKIWTGCKIAAVSSTPAATSQGWPKISLNIVVDGAEKTVDGDALLIAAGRAPNIEGLALEAAGVDFTPGVGIKVGIRCNSCCFYHVRLWVTMP